MAQRAKRVRRDRWALQTSLPPLAKSLEGAIGGCVVTQDDLKVLVVAAHQALETLDGVRPAIQVDDRDVDRRAATRHTARRWPRAHSRRRARNRDSARRWSLIHRSMPACRESESRRFQEC